MSEKSSSSSSSGIGCGGLLAVLLTVLFVGLKLTGHIAWSWIWVISPILIYIGLVVLVIGIVLGIAAIIAIIAGIVKYHDNKQARLRREEQRQRLEEQRFTSARSLGVFDSQGEPVKTRRTR